MMSKNPKRVRARAKKAAKRLPAYMQDVAFSKWGRKPYFKGTRKGQGKFGPASEVRHIDPSEYQGDLTLGDPDE